MKPNNSLCSKVEHSKPHNPGVTPDRQHHPAPARKPFRAEPFKISFWVLGVGSVLWLLWRSGTNPKRLAYPCQQAAALNAIAFLGYVGSLLGVTVLYRRFRTRLTVGRFVALLVALVLLAGIQSDVVIPATPAYAASPALPSWTSASAVSSVFAVTNSPAPLYSLNGGTVPAGVAPAEALHDSGVDALVNLMETRGDYFYKTTAHPTGLFSANDVIVIKVNNQWSGRNSTNTDVVKGIIYRLVQHPQGFSGAVIIAENSQSKNTDWPSESGNNSQFQDQSYQEVASAFASQGYHVCTSNWDSFRTTLVSDYDAGNNSNGYVLDTTDNKLSYPKFQLTNCGGVNLNVSMKKGIWNGSSFDAARLKMVNLPVLKRHGSQGATIAVKNYLGFTTTYVTGTRWAGVPEIHCWLTGTGSSCSAASQAYGLVGQQMALIRRADLDVVDASWVNPCDNVGWHGEAERQDVLLASRDPFAVDYYASEYILGPRVQAHNGQCGVSTPENSLASTHGGIFRNILLRNVARLRALGVTNTININDSLTRAQELAQFNAFVVDASGRPANTPTPLPATVTRTATRTPVPPSNTPTRTSTNTPLPRTATSTVTTSTMTRTATRTATHTATTTSTPIPPTKTNTPLPATITLTPLLPTSTQTAIPPTATRTPTTPPPTPTWTATLTSSSDLVFKDGFENGNLSAWSSSVTDQNDLAVGSSAALAGSAYGLQVTMDDNTSIYVTDDTPNAETHLRLRFYFDPNTVIMANGDSLYLLIGFSGTTTPVFCVEFSTQNGYQLRAAFTDDLNAAIYTPWVSISDAPHFFELDWFAASAGANNGGFTLWLDGTQQAAITGANNDALRIDRVQLGAVYGIDAGTRGTLYFDAYESRRQTYIGQ